jgi:two-component system chemotaxis sensor kinase CheA
MNKSRKFALRHLAFICGLVALVISAAAYVKVQHTLQSSVRLEHVLAKNVGRIMTLDEVLTMSARMASSAKDDSYEARYKGHVDELDHLIKSTLSLVPDEQVTLAVSTTDKANLRLVELETQSFQLNKEGRHAEALTLLEGLEYKTNKAEYAAGMARAFSRLAELTADSTAAAERLATLLRLATLVSLLLVVGAWATEQRVQRKQAAQYATRLEVTVAERTSELAQRNRSMRLVLDTVQQGLIGVDLAGTMAGECSAIVQTWLGSVSSQMKLSDQVRAYDAEFANWFELGLEQLREGTLPVEVCIGQMPKRLQLAERSLAVDYEPILANDQCEGFLVVMSDITVELKRERIEAEQRDMIQVLEHIAKDRTGFFNFLTEADSLVAEVNRSRLQPQGSLTRVVHTLKGITAQFGMASVAEICHSLEDRLRENVELSSRDHDLLIVTWKNLRDRIRTMVGDRSHSHVEVARKDYQSAIELVERRAGYEQIAALLQSWELDPIQARLERLGEYGQELAARLGKPAPEVVCNGGDLRVDNAAWAPLWAACVHLIRNAVDHGLEAPAERSQALKSARGRLTLSATRDEQALVLTFSDDGRGVQWNQLGDKARHRGLPFETDAQKVEALFQDGVSTSEGVTEISGRGLGLAAVREQVQLRGGTMRVLSRELQGTTVELRIPLARSASVAA